MTLTLKVRQIGDRLQDGSIFCGVSPHTNEPFYAAQSDVQDMFTWIDAVNFARRLGNGWRLPSMEEMSVLYAHREVIGGFQQCKAYWVESPHFLNMCWSVGFKDGYASAHRKHHAERFLRCVRGVDYFTQR